VATAARLQAVREQRLKGLTLRDGTGLPRLGR
jgi:hypothetical protein